jgi:peptide/nickel transport system substrate-binding protein
VNDRSSRLGIRALAAVGVIAAIAAVSGCGGGGTSNGAAGGATTGGVAGVQTTSSASGPLQHGGAITVAEGSGFAGAWPSGLDPATNTNGAADQSYMSSIYGQLFELREGGKVVPDLATGWKISDGGKTVSIFLRKGVKFSDGTPFNAAAVVWNVQRDLKSACTCKPTWPLDKKTPITTPNANTVEFHLTQPYGAFIASLFDSNVSWIASPTAFKKMGAKAFSLRPVGAGPFTVVSNTPSSVLVLKRNPSYWQQGRPYLDKLTFKSVSGDESALEAMQAGQVQAYENLSTPSLADQARKNGLVVTQQLGTSPYDIQLNTKIPPFDNPKARLAIYYATDTNAIVQHIFNNMYPVTQGFTGPGGLFYSPKVPGYPTYDPAKAKQLVKQLGGLTINLGTINVLVATQTITALQQMWQAAGMKVTIKSYDLLPLIQQFQRGKWQAMLQTVGAWDPAAGVGVMFRFSSQSPFSGVHDPKLDALLGKAAATLDQGKRKQLYDQAAKYMAVHAYGPNLFAFAPANVASKNVAGPGLTTKLPAVVVTPTIPWEQVGLTGSSAR